MLEKRDSTPKGMAARVGVSVSYIYKLLERGELKGRKAGKRTIILPEDERAWLDSLPDYKEAG